MVSRISFGRRSALSALLGLGVVALAPAAGAAQQWVTRGTIVSIGPDRTTLRVHHEDIPGYMKAMTMTFDCTPKQIEGLAASDRVELAFEETADHRRPISWIRKA